MATLTPAQMLDHAMDALSLCANLADKGLHENTSTYYQINHTATNTLADIARAMLHPTNYHPTNHHPATQADYLDDTAEHIFMANQTSNVMLATTSHGTILILYHPEGNCWSYIREGAEILVDSSYDLVRELQDAEISIQQVIPLPGMTILLPDHLTPAVFQ